MVVANSNAFLGPCAVDGMFTDEAFDCFDFDRMLNSPALASDLADLAATVPDVDDGIMASCDAASTHLAQVRLG